MINTEKEQAVSQDTPETVDTPKAEVAQPARRKKRGRNVLFVLFVLIAAAAASAYSMIGRPVDAPDWVRERIENRIAEALPGIDVQFGRMSLLVQRTGLARVILWDVNIRNDQGEQVAQLSDIEAGLSPSALLTGKLVLREAQVSGAFVTLQRDERGRFGLALGDVFSEGTDVPDLKRIITQIDSAFSDPRLARLDVFEADALTVRYEDQRARRGWTADGGRLRLERIADRLELSGDVALLGGGSGVATLEVNAASPIGETAMDFGVVLHDLDSHDIATQSPALAWLNALDAPISGALRSRVLQDGSLGLLNASLRIGSGVLQPNRATRPLPFDKARTYFTYDPKIGLLDFDEIQVVSPLGTVGATGKAQLEGVTDGWLTGLAAQVKLTDMSLAEGTLLDRTLAVSGADVSFRLDLNPFRVSLGALHVSDPDFPVTVSGSVQAGPDGWQLALDTQVAKTTVPQVLSHWPVTFRPETRHWVAQNVKKGRLRNVVFALRATPDASPYTYLDFVFDQGKATYNTRLPGLDNIAGRLTIDGTRLGLRMDSGRLLAGDGLDMAGSEFVIPNLKAKTPTGELRLKGKGKLRSALAYLDNDAWRILRKAGRDAKLATGRVQVTGKVSMPLIKGLRLGDVSLKISGRLSDVKSDTLIKGRALTAKSLDLSVTNKEVSISGDVRLSGVAASGTWRQPLVKGDGSVTADLQLTPKALNAFGIDLPNGMVRGSGAAALRVDLPKNASPKFKLTSKLSGIGISIPQLGWAMSQRQTGTLEVAGTLGQPVAINVVSLAGNGLRAKGEVSLHKSGAFDTLTLERLRIDDWLDVTGRLRARGKGQAPAVEVASGRLDLRKSRLGEGQGNGGGGRSADAVPISANLSTVQITDSIVLKNFRGNFQTGNGLNGRFDAALGGAAPIKGVVVPNQGRSAFKINGEDAGDVLKAAGLLKTVANGTFELRLKPVAGQTGTYDGALDVKGARLRKAPAIGALLDAISIVGLIDQLNGPGIFFAEVEARFRLSPQRLVLTRSSAVGPSMGISMDGFYDMNTGGMDMQGVVSPIYIVNGIGRLISRKGEGLIGFNFNLKGSISTPRVLVNPLSVFTPGMFRDIFRRPPPQVSQ